MCVLAKTLTFPIERPHLRACDLASLSTHRRGAGSWRSAASLGSASLPAAGGADEHTFFGVAGVCVVYISTCMEKMHIPQYIYAHVWDACLVASFLCSRSLSLSAERTHVHHCKHAILTQGFIRSQLSPSMCIFHNVYATEFFVRNGYVRPADTPIDRSINQSIHQRALSRAGLDLQRRLVGLQRSAF